MGIPAAFYLYSEVAKKPRSIKSSLQESRKEWVIMFDVQSWLYRALPLREKASKP